MAEDTKLKNVTITSENSERFSGPRVSSIKEYAECTVGGQEKSLVTDNGSVSVRSNGDIDIAAGNHAQVKLNKAFGNVEIVSSKTDIKTVNLSAETNDIIINRHKLNNKLYELADWKKVKEKTTATSDDKSKNVTTYGTVGGITMLGTVLTRSWCEELGRYVMIRRLVNIPVFSPNIGN